MGVTSERHDGSGLTGEVQVPHHSAGAACCESHTEYERDHEHGFEVVEVLRVVFVALAAAVWFQPRGRGDRPHCLRNELC